MHSTIGLSYLQLIHPPIIIPKVIVSADHLHPKEKKITYRYYPLIAHVVI